jgi:hypothetical protein
LSREEILVCEKNYQKFISEADFEIELHNLNEVNEYFRIFKEEIKRMQAKFKPIPPVKIHLCKDDSSSLFN